MDVNPKPTCEDKNLRSCGGHVHVGTKHDPIHVVKAMDIYLGVPSLKLDPDKQRRKLYGKAGAFRFKSYGVEYRTLSNFWIWSKELQEWVFKQTNKALEHIEGLGQGNWNTNWDDIIRGLINGNFTEKDHNVYMRKFQEYHPYVA